MATDVYQTHGLLGGLLSTLTDGLLGMQLFGRTALKF